MIQWIKDNQKNIRFRGYENIEVEQYIMNDFILILEVLDELDLFEWEITVTENSGIYILDDLVLYNESIVVTDDFGLSHEIKEVFTKMKLLLSYSKVNLGDLS